MHITFPPLVSLYFVQMKTISTVYNVCNYKWLFGRLYITFQTLLRRHKRLLRGSVTVSLTVDPDGVPCIFYCVARFWSFYQNFLACLPCLLYFHPAAIRMWHCRDSVSRCLLSLKPSWLSNPGDLSLSRTHADLEDILFRELCVCVRVCKCESLRDRKGGAGIWSGRAFISLWVGSLWGPSQKLSISSIVLFPSLASLLSHVKLQKASYTRPPPSFGTPFPHVSASQPYNPLSCFWKYFKTLQFCLLKLEF